MLSAAAGTGEVPATLEAIIVHTDHIAVFQLRLAMVIAVRHHQAEEKIVTGFLRNPFEGFVICSSSIIALIVLEEVNPEITHAKALEIADITFDPLFRAFFVDIDPEEHIVEILLPSDVHGSFTICPLNGAVCKVSGTGHPHGIIVHANLHSFVGDILVPVFKPVLPLTVILGNIPILVDGLSGLNPPVITDHVIPVIPEILGHPVNVVFPSSLRNGFVMIKAPFVRNPILWTRSATSVFTVPGKQACACQRQNNNK